jgi:hypothetical protein
LVVEEAMCAERVIEIRFSLRWLFLLITFVGGWLAIFRIHPGAAVFLVAIAVPAVIRAAENLGQHLEALKARKLLRLYCCGVLALLMACPFATWSLAGLLVEGKPGGIAGGFYLSIATWVPAFLITGVELIRSKLARKRRLHHLAAKHHRPARGDGQH